MTTGGSFVASSLDIWNQNFMAGQTLRFKGGASEGVVKNLGSISSSGGDVYFDIVATGTSTATQNPTGTFSANVDTSLLSTADLVTALGQGNVIVQTGATAGAQAGNIDVQAGFTWANANSLTLSAFNGIIVDNGVTITNTGGGSVILRANNTGIGGVSGAGLTAGFGAVIFNGTGAQVALSGGTTPVTSISSMMGSTPGPAHSIPLSLTRVISRWPPAAHSPPSSS